MNSEQLSIATSGGALGPVCVDQHRNQFVDRFHYSIVLAAIAQTAVRFKNITP